MQRRSTSAPADTISGPSSSTSRPPSRTVTSRRRTRPRRARQRERRGDRLDRPASRPAPTTIRALSRSPASGPACVGTNAARTTAPRARIRGARRSPRRSSADRVTGGRALDRQHGDGGRPSASGREDGRGAGSGAPLALECRCPPAAANAAELRADPVRHRPRVRRGDERQRVHRQLAAARPGVAEHPRDVGADVRREVGLVDHEQVRARDPRPALARDVVAAGDVDDEDLHVGERRAEDRREVVAAALDEHELERPLVALELLDGLEVDRDVVADRGVRAAAGLHGDDPLGLEHAGRAQELGVLGRVDVVRHDAEAHVARQLAAERRDQAALARADGPADADPQRALSAFRRQRGAPCVVRGGRRRARARRPPGAACWATGRVVVGELARDRADVRREVGQPARRLRRVEAEQLQRRAGDGRGVVVERDHRDLEVAEPGRRRRRRRARPAAACVCGVRRGSGRSSALGQAIAALRRSCEPRRRATSRRTGLGQRAACSSSSAARPWRPRRSPRRRRAATLSAASGRATSRSRAAMNGATPSTPKPSATACSSPSECA